MLFFARTLESTSARHSGQLTKSIESDFVHSIFLADSLRQNEDGLKQANIARVSAVLRRGSIHPHRHVFYWKKWLPLRHDHPVGGDHVISKFFQKHDFTIWHHLPSLAQHSAPIGNSTVGNQNMTRNRKANSFPGEDCDASEPSFPSELP